MKTPAIAMSEETLDVVVVKELALLGSLLLVGCCVRDSQRSCSRRVTGSAGVCILFQMATLVLHGAGRMSIAPNCLLPSLVSRCKSSGRMVRGFVRLREGPLGSLPTTPVCGAHSVLRVVLLLSQQDWLANYPRLSESSACVRLQNRYHTRAALGLWLPMPVPFMHGAQLLSPCHQPLQSRHSFFLLHFHRRSMPSHLLLPRGWGLPPRQS